MIEGIIFMSIMTGSALVLNDFIGLQKKESHLVDLKVSNVILHQQLYQDFLQDSHICNANFKNLTIPAGGTALNLTQIKKDIDGSGTTVVYYETGKNFAVSTKLKFYFKSIKLFYEPVAGNDNLSAANINNDGIKFNTMLEIAYAKMNEKNLGGENFPPNYIPIVVYTDGSRKILNCQISEMNTSWKMGKNANEILYPFGPVAVGHITNVDDIQGPFEVRRNDSNPSAFPQTNFISLTKFNGLSMIGMSSLGMEGNNSVSFNSPTGLNLVNYSGTTILMRPQGSANDSGLSIGTATSNTNNFASLRLPDNGAFDVYSTVVPATYSRYEAGNNVTSLQGKFSLIDTSGGGVASYGLSSGGSGEASLLSSKDLKLKAAGSIFATTTGGISFVSPNSLNLTAPHNIGLTGTHAVNGLIKMIGNNITFESLSDNIKILLANGTSFGIRQNTPLSSRTIYFNAGSIVFADNNVPKVTLTTTPNHLLVKKMSRATTDHVCIANTGGTDTTCTYTWANGCLTSWIAVGKGAGADEQEHAFTCPPNTILTGLRIKASDKLDGDVEARCCGVKVNPL